MKTSYQKPEIEPINISGWLLQGGFGGYDGPSGEHATEPEAKQNKWWTEDELNQKDSPWSNDVSPINPQPWDEQ